MKTRIGVDIDGVVAYHSEMTIDKINAHFGVNFLPRMNTTYSFEDGYLREFPAMDRAELHAFIVHLFDQTDHLSKAPPFLPMIGALRVLSGMSLDPGGVTFITARKPEKAAMTKTWIDRHGIAYHKIVHTTEKVTYCQRNGIKYMIEDAPQHAQECAQGGIGVFLLDWPFNQDVVATGVNGIWRVPNARDIPALIQADLSR